MKVRALLLAAGLATSAIAHARQVNWENERLHSYEQAFYFHGAPGNYENSQTIKLDLGRVQCVDRIQLSLEATSGSPTVFLVSVGTSNRAETLIQDIHQGTITPPRVDPHYPFRIRAAIGQATLMVGGGNIRLHAARAVIVPDCQFER